MAQVTTLLTRAEIENGFELISFDLQDLRTDLKDIDSRISELNATFHWGFSNLIAEIGGMADNLDELIKISKTPAQNAAYEQFEIARDAFRKGLYPECLEALDKAINGDQSSAGYKLEWRFHQLVGIIRMGFFNGDLSLIDLGKAEESFLKAARYAEADFKKDSGFSFLAAGWAAYCNGKMHDALAHTDNALKILSDREEALFQKAKVLMALDEPDKALQTFKSAIKIDKFYILKAAGDGSFQKYEEKFNAFLEKLRQEKIEIILEKFKKGVQIENAIKKFKHKKLKEAILSKYDRMIVKIRNLPIFDLIALESQQFKRGNLSLDE
jgi:tetratricopeptide (TPR) repeat protein